MWLHQSQFFEWLPWLAGRLDEVPKDEKTQLEWLGKQWKREITPEIRTSLVKWYGEEKGNKATIVEAFEISEYGRKPNDEEIRQLFPMLGK